MRSCRLSAILVNKCYVEPANICDVSRTLHANQRFLFGMLAASCSQGWYWSTGRSQTHQCERIIPITCVEHWLELQRDHKSTNHRETNFLVMWITNLVSTWWLFPSAVIPGNSLSVTQKGKLVRAHAERLRVAAKFQVFCLGVGLFFCAEVIKEQKSKESSCNQLWEGAESISDSERFAKLSSFDENKLETGLFLFIYTESGNTDCYMPYFTNPPHHTHVRWHLWAFQHTLPVQEEPVGAEKQKLGYENSKALPIAIN